jgi:hypothetical protein
MTLNTNRWTSDENVFLMKHAHKAPWSQIAASLGRTELACKKHFEKLVDLRKKMGTWNGI